MSWAHEAASGPASQPPDLGHPSAAAAPSKRPLEFLKKPPQSNGFFRTVAPRAPKRARHDTALAGAWWSRGKDSGGRQQPRPQHPPIERSELGLDQKRVYDAIGKSQFHNSQLSMQGDAGTGKSFLTKAIISGLQAKLANKNSGSTGKYAVAITAPTGIAAAGIGGVTLHSWAGIGLGTDSSRDLIATIRRKRDSLMRWTHAKVLIIDEVSMLDGSLFDKLDHIGRAIRKQPSLPFGGIQVVLAGDFWQLPPTPNSHGPQPIFCFQSTAWNAVVEECFVLTEIRRQKDAALVRLLRDVRYGSVSAASRKLLDAAKKVVLDTTDGVQPTRLYSRNDQADAVNTRELHRLPGSVVSYRSVDYTSAKGHNEVQAVDKKFSTVPHVLDLKVGAQVLLLKNLSPSEGLINGSRGVVVRFQRHKLAGQLDQYDLPVVRFADSTGCIADPIERVVVPEEWSLIQAGVVQMSRVQIPLRLAWAITIHKSQGMTIGKLEVALANVFEPGMAYVALSRGVSLDAIRVLDYDVARITASRHLEGFSETVRRMSAESAARRRVSLEPSPPPDLKETEVMSVGDYVVSAIDLDQFDPSPPNSEAAPANASIDAPQPKSALTAEQRARIERNRQLAQERRLARLQADAAEGAT